VGVPGGWWVESPTLGDNVDGECGGGEGAGGEGVGLDSVLVVRR
jgi:hypothetical protein